MPEDPEVPTEHLHETIHEEVEKGAEGWVLRVALTAALLAVFAAVTSLLAGHHANEAMIDQIQASDQWAYYQAKGIKGSLLESKLELLRALGKETSAQDEEKVAEYKEEQKRIQETATEKEKSSEAHLMKHNRLARSVTIFQIAIAMAAISVLTKRRWLWYASVILGIASLGIFVQSL